MIICYAVARYFGISLAELTVIEKLLSAAEANTTIFFSRPLDRQALPIDKSPSDKANFADI